MAGLEISGDCRHVATGCTVLVITMIIIIISTAVSKSS